MRSLLLMTLLLINLNLNDSTEPMYGKSLSTHVVECPNIVKIRVEAYHKLKYEEVISFIKLHEGFRATPYDDAGYPAIGYGQRLKFFSNFKIGNKITKQEADHILKLSFNNHLKYIDHYFPGLTELQRYAIAHISYSVGLGNAMKFGYFYKKDGKWHINKYKLFNSRKVDRTRKNYRDNRKFEYNLFYNL